MGVTEVLERYEELSNSEKKELEIYLRRTEYDVARAEIKDRAEIFNKKYAGRCFKRKEKPDSIFPKMEVYYKILNFRSQLNPYCPEALSFPEYPLYWFNYQSSKAGQPGDYYLGRTDFIGIEVDSMTLFSTPLGGEQIRPDYEEISIEEYNKAMQLYVDRLAQMKFICDHNRQTNLKPADPAWCRH